MTLKIHKKVCDGCSVIQNVNFHTCLFFINSHIFSSFDDGNSNFK